ncbi:MAG: hypothetical protein NTY02_06800 [Acidobacteria bacterium]|nr:hypothetical protein [Acidobacteriota bacterium]
MSEIFQHLLVLGRPACGKSEFIDFLKHASDDMRRRRLHIGTFEEVDDFPWLWEKFLDDAIWEKAGYERLYTEEYMPGNPGMAPKGAKLFDWCMHKFNEVITAQYVGRAEFYRESTLLIEFSRGGEDGFRRALGMLDRSILERAAIFYIHVSREESWRRNVARYQEKLRHSILAHMVPRQTYDHFYDVNDWEALTGGASSGTLDVNGLTVPFVTMKNEPESTDPAVLEERYATALGQLWQRQGVTR